MKKLVFLLFIFSCTNSADTTKSSIPSNEAFDSYFSTPEAKAEILESKKMRDMLYADSAILSWVAYSTVEGNNAEEDNSILFEKVEKYKADPTKVLGEYWYVKYSLEGEESEGYFTLYKNKIIDRFTPEDYEILTTQSDRLLK